MNGPGAHFLVFDTDFGPCGIAWSERGLTRLLLPGEERGKLEARLARRAIMWSGPVLPDEIAKAVTAIVRYFAGERVELDAIGIDLIGVGDLHRRVYDEARRLTWGRTATYGEITRRIGEPREAAREVGQALGRNPLPLIVPCHRVLAAGGRIGGFSAPGGIATKARMLELEGIRVGADELQPSLFAPADLLPATAPR